MHRTLIAAAALVAALPALAADLFVLAGQSNMSGRGEVESLTASERAPDPAIRLYGNDGRWKPAAEPLDDATAQVDPVSADARAGVGPGLFFARSYRARAKRAVDLLPCAKGGSSIGRWKPATARDTLYGSCLARIGESGARPAGLIWYQGESDAESPVNAARWAERFTAMLNAWRADLKQPDLPVVVVRLAEQPGGPENAARFPGWTTVQRAQGDLRLPCVSVVSVAGLALNPDQLHLATAGQRVLGPAIATAMHALQQARCGRANRRAGRRSNLL